MNPTTVNVIEGKNRMGKTSFLKAIRAAFTGDADSTSIRIGENKAEITIELEDLDIRRTITPHGNKLSISNKEGMVMPAPQKYLDGIMGNLSFNPVAFFDLKAADRKKYLLSAIPMKVSPEWVAIFTGEKLAGLDYEGTHALEIIEQVRKFYYDKRTVANSEVTKKEKSLQDLTESIPEGFDPNKVSEEEITKLREAIAKDEMEAMKSQENRRYVESLRKQEEQLTKKLEELAAELKNVQQEIVDKLALKFDYSDPMAIGAAKDTLAKLESQRSLVFASKRAEEVRGELDVSLKEASRLDAVVKSLTKEVPAKLIEQAQLPVKGLTIEGDEMLIDGVNLDNLSSSEQLKFGIAIAKAINGQFKIICCDGLELLDKETFEAFLKEFENGEYQLFVTRVDGNTPHSIIIEDGEIKK